MKEAIGGLGITQIVIFFLLVFAAYISVSINMNKAYKVKNEIITDSQIGYQASRSAVNEISTISWKLFSIKLSTISPSSVGTSDLFSFCHTS